MPHILFVTGKLAEPALRRVLADLGPRVGFEYSVAIMPITVIALATTSWLARHLTLAQEYQRIIIPGSCLGELTKFADHRVERGPEDLRDLPEYFGSMNTTTDNYGVHDITILAEIDERDGLLKSYLAQAVKAKTEGADIIDLGCDPGTTWEGIYDAVRMLCDCGLRVSVDTFNSHEASLGAKAGAEIVLSVNRTNRDAAHDWGCEVVAVPDMPADLEGLDETLNVLQKANVRFRIDPILEPIGFGFAASLGRYLEARRRYADLEMMMGIGNLTELTDVDSAGVNVVLLGFCQEMGIRSVLTTEVINWCRSCVRELNLARRLVFHAVKNHILPKNLENDLIMLRDPRLNEHGQPTLQQLSEDITDKNFRLFAERGLLHVMNGDIFLQGTDPFALFAEMLQHGPIEPSHAFYLGFELAKAATAMTLGKNYVQDQALRWGFLTRAERSPSTPR